MTTYPVHGPWPGELVIIPRPRGGDWLEDDAKSLRNEGFNIVVSLLTPEEVKELELTCEAKLIREQGLQYCNYSIPDRGVPASRESARNLLEKLRLELLAGKKIAVHCRGSIGRAGLVASSLLVLAGMSPSQAISEVSEARKFQSPETTEQREW